MSEITENPDDVRPDIVLTAHAQMAILHALEIAKHNQEFRDGRRKKAFSGAFAVRQINYALKMLGDAMGAADPVTDDEDEQFEELRSL
jgi:hypothetical protein